MSTTVSLRMRQVSLVAVVAGLAAVSYAMGSIEAREDFARRVTRDVSNPRLSLLRDTDVRLDAGQPVVGDPDLIARADALSERAWQYAQEARALWFQTEGTPEFWVYMAAQHELLSTDFDCQYLRTGDISLIQPAIAESGSGAECVARSWGPLDSPAIPAGAGSGTRAGGRAVYGMSPDALARAGIRPPTPQEQATAEASGLTSEVWAIVRQTMQDMGYVDSQGIPVQPDRAPRKEAGGVAPSPAAEQQAPPAVTARETPKVIRRPKTALELRLEEAAKQPDADGRVLKVWQPDAKLPVVHVSVEPGTVRSQMRKLALFLAAEAQAALAEGEAVVILDIRGRELMRAQYRKGTKTVFTQDIP
jgi:hypothetical protein